MQKVSEAISDVVNLSDHAKAKYGEPVTERFLDASKEFACWALENLTDDLLDRALAVSRAMAHFHAGLVHPELLK